MSGPSTLEIGPVHLSKHVPLRGISISLGDIRSIYNRLMIQLGEQANIEIASLMKPADKAQAEWDAYIASARENAFKITTTVTGRDGSSLMGNTAAVFNAANLPDKIESIFLSNVATYQNFSGVQPAHRFSLNFDFSKPPLFEVGIAVSAPTANLTNLQVQGNRDAWVSGVQAAVEAITSGRTTRSRWLHRSFMYDLGLLLLGFPLTFFFCWKLSSAVNHLFGAMGGFVLAIVYLYLGLVFLNVYRGLFGYSKWAFPLVELTDNKDVAGRHRAILATIAISLVGRVIWEFVVRL